MNLNELEGKEYPQLRKFLTWIFFKTGHGFSDRLVRTVIHAALAWDISPSMISNAVDEYL